MSDVVGRSPRQMGGADGIEINSGVDNAVRC